MQRTHGQTNLDCTFRLRSPNQTTNQIRRSYSRFQVAFQIAFRILVRIYGYIAACSLPYN